MPGLNEKSPVGFLEQATLSMSLTNCAHKPTQPPTLNGRGRVVCPSDAQLTEAASVCLRVASQV